MVAKEKAQRRVSWGPVVVENITTGDEGEFRWESCSDLSPISAGHGNALRNKTRFSSSPYSSSPNTTKDQGLEGRRRADSNTGASRVGSTAAANMNGNRSKAYAGAKQQPKNSCLKRPTAEKATIPPPPLVASNIRPSAKRTQVLDWLRSGIGSNTEDPNSIIPLPDLEYAASRRRRAASYACDVNALTLPPWQQQRAPSSSPLTTDTSTFARCSSTDHLSSSSRAADGESARALGAMRVSSSASEEQPQQQPQQPQQPQQQSAAGSTANTPRGRTPSRLPLSRLRHSSKHKQSNPLPLPHLRLHPASRQSTSPGKNNHHNNNTNNPQQQQQQQEQQQKQRHSSYPLTPATDPDLPASCIPDRRSSIRVIKTDLALPSSSDPHPHPHPHHTPAATNANPTHIPTPTPTLTPTPHLTRKLPLRSRDMSGDGKYSFYYDSGEDESAVAGCGGTDRGGKGEGDKDKDKGKGKGKGVDRGEQQQQQQQHQQQVGGQSSSGGDNRESWVDDLRLSEAGRYQLATMYSDHESYNQATSEPKRVPTPAHSVGRGTPPPKQAELHRTGHAQAQVKSTPRKQQAGAATPQKQRPDASSTAEAFGHSHRGGHDASARASPYKTPQHHQRQNSNNVGRSDVAGGGFGPSPERGRYELLSDDEGNLYPIQDTTQSNVTTFTDIIRQGLEPSPSQSPIPYRAESRPRSPPKPTYDTFVPPVPALPAAVATDNRGYYPIVLDMGAAHRYGQTTGRHTDIEVVHVPIRGSPSSSKLSFPKKTKPQVSEQGPSRGRQTPAPALLKLDKGKQPESAQQKNRQHPLRHERTDKKDELRYSSSVYEWDEDLPTISPLHVPKRSDMAKVDILKQYNDWYKDTHMAAARRAESPASPQPRVEYQTARHQATLHNVRSRSEMGQRDLLPDERSTALASHPVYDLSSQQQTQPSPRAGLPKSATMSDVRDGGDSQFRSDSRPRLEPLVQPFTPLTPWLMSGGLSNMAGGLTSQKKSKVLIGEDGYLEDTAPQAQAQEQDQKKKKTSPSKASGFFDKCMNIARELAETSFRANRSSKPAGAARQMLISLDPREQSLVYCELEFNLSTALDEYIKTQLNKGRLCPDRLKRAADAWASQGRPPVTGFRYDLETQVGLVEAHADRFRFYGAAQVDPGAVVGLLHAVRGDARQMRARTYCQPDAAVFKHLQDAAALMRLLGAPDATQTRLDQVSQFFQAIVARETEYYERARGRENGSGDDKGEAGRGRTTTAAATAPDENNNHRDGSAAADAGPSPNAHELLADSLYGGGGGTGTTHAVSRDDDDQGKQGRNNDGEGEDHDASEPKEKEERRFSGPILEPKTYDPTKDEPYVRRRVRRYS